MLQATNEMSPNVKEDRAWTYWRGRALAQSGKLVEARQEWIKASSPFSFYGKLAHEELGDTVTAPKRPELLSAAELEAGIPNSSGTRRCSWTFMLHVLQQKQ